MSQSKSAGYVRTGLPYNLMGHGPRPLIIFQGLMLENKPQPGWTFKMASGMNNFLRRGSLQLQRSPAPDHRAGADRRW